VLAQTLHYDEGFRGGQVSRHVAEAQVRIAIMNGHTDLGIPVTKAVG